MIIFHPNFVFDIIIFSMRTSLTDLGLLIFRVGVSYWMIAYHGVVKLQQLFSGEEIQFADPIGIGILASFFLALFAEFICSILVALGVWTRLAAIPLAITMIVAFFFHHGADPLVKRQLPGMFLLAYVLLIMLGGGKYALVKSKRFY